MNRLIVGAVVAALSSVALADVSVGQFTDKRATMSDDKGVTRDGSQVYANFFSKKVEEKTGFFTTNGAMFSTSKHRDEVRLCAESALDQTLSDVVADRAFLAAITSGHSSETH